MSRSILPRISATVVLLAVVATSACPIPAAAVPPAQLKSVTLHVFNRVFAGFHDKVVAVKGKDFRVGDSDFSARIVRFEPDFTFDLKTRKAISLSGEPNNPAFQIIVSRKGVPHDTSWAFFNLPPHYSGRSELAFVATRIEFTNRPVLVSTDSLAIKIQQREGGAH
jgi:hypothetical protein